MRDARNSVDGFETVASSPENFELGYCARRHAVWLSLQGFRSVEKGLEALRTLEGLVSSHPCLALIFDYRDAEYPEDLFAALQMYAHMVDFLPGCTVITLREDQREPITPLLTLELRAAGIKVIAVGDETAAIEQIEQLQ
ncbi:hypothetical protein ACFELO_07685 [Oceanicaulis sp. LC35]|uniref:hypothetical protein n=1 Tax=Oceanicaulis sp. LC35 TaxID=3349635 RepID=UPI003F85B3C5